MARRANLSRVNNWPRRRERETRVIVAALVEREEHLLLTQLARGRFAGFWLLPSSSVESGPWRSGGAHAAERTGYEVRQSHLLCVQEEPKVDVLALRFVFHVTVGERESAVADPEIAQARWFSRAAVQEVLEERDVTPNLGVMSLIRAWWTKRRCVCWKLYRRTPCAPAVQATTSVAAVAGMRGEELGVRTLGR